MARNKNLTNGNDHSFGAELEAAPGVPGAKLEGSGEIGQSAAERRNFSRSSDATICVRAARGGGFKKCCMRTGKYDGSDRHYYRRD